MNEPAKTLSASAAWPARWLWTALAWLCIALGLLGVVLPGLPTTPFILLAAALAAKGSPRLRQRLLEHRLCGPAIRDWESYGAVSRRAKRLAVLAMAACGAFLWLVGAPIWSLILAGAAMSGVALWLWRRPEPPAAAESQMAGSETR